MHPVTMPCKTHRAGAQRTCSFSREKSGSAASGSPRSGTGLPSPASSLRAASGAASVPSSHTCRSVGRGWWGGRTRREGAEEGREGWWASRLENEGRRCRAAGCARASEGRDGRPERFKHGAARLAARAADRRALCCAPLGGPRGRSCSSEPLLRPWEPAPPPAARRRRCAWACWAVVACGKMVTSRHGEAMAGFRARDVTRR